MKSEVSSKNYEKLSPPIWQLILLFAAFICSYAMDKIFYSFNKEWATHLPANPFLWDLSWLGIRLAPLLIVGFVISRQKLLFDLGLDRDFLKAIGAAFLFTLPLFIGMAVVAEFNREISLYKVWDRCIQPGFYEEVLCRSFLLGLLIRRFKWGFVPAALICALFFGAWHVYQGHNFASSLGAFAITALGAVWFGWLYAEWRFNAWINIGLHTFMNLSWLMFSVEGGALGGIWSNVFRAMTVVLSIVFTLKWLSKKEGFVISRKALWINRN